MLVFATSKINLSNDLKDFINARMTGVVSIVNVLELALQEKPELEEAIIQMIETHGELYFKIT